MKASKRHALFILVALIIGGLVGTLIYRTRLRQQEAAKNSRTVIRVLALTGVFQKPILQKLEDEKHLRIELTEAVDPEALWDIFDAPSNTHFDVVTLMSYQVPAAIQMVRVIPLSASRLKWTRISGDFRAIPGDTGHNRVVPILWGLSAMLYDENKQDSAPESWQDVFNDKSLKGHIGLLRSPIQLLNWIAKTSESGGDEESDVGPSDADIRKSLKPILTVSQFSKTALSSTDLLSDPAGSQKPSAGSPSANSVVEMNIAEYETLSQAQKSHWKMILPREPSPLWILSLAITADSKLEKESYQLLDAMTDPEFAKLMIETNHQATTLVDLNRAAIPQAAKASHLREIPLTQIQLQHDFQGARAVHAAMEDEPGITDSTSE